MYFLSASVPRHIQAFCSKSSVVSGSLSIKQFHQAAVCHNIISTKLHIRQVFLLEKRCVSLRQPIRGIQRKDVIIQTFFPLYTKDNVPRDYEMIYQSNLGTKQVNMMVMVGVIIVSYCFLLANWTLKICGTWDTSEKITVPVINIELSKTRLNFYGMYFLLLCYWLAYCYRFATLPVRRIYESVDKTKYIGILRKMPWSSERIEFGVSDIEHIPNEGRSMLKKGNSRIKGKPCILYATDFKSRTYFNKFLGFDENGNSEQNAR